MTKRALDQLSVVALADKLRMICIDNGDGSCSFNEGWSDQRLVDESIGKMTLANVTGLRERMFGKIAAPKPAEPLQVAMDRIVRLESALSAVCYRIDALEKWGAERPVVPFRAVSVYHC
jgi:hypothetical protein